MNLCEISSLLSANVLLFLALGRMQSASTNTVEAALWRERECTYWFLP